MTFPHRHPSKEAQLAHIRAGIALQGFALLHVLGTRQEPAYSYTVGLHQPGSNRPELVISGLQTALRVAWLLDLGFRIQGPPPLETRQRIAQSQGIPLDAQVYPPGGTIFEPGKCTLDLAGNGLPTFFAMVDPAAYETHLGQAILFHQTHTFPALQVVWPDTHGHFPWEASFETRFVGKQCFLFDMASLR